MPLLSVKPLQGLSECTVQLFVESTYGLYSLQRVLVPVQYMYITIPTGL